jgi:penicillin-binding protein 2
MSVFNQSRSNIIRLIFIGVFLVIVAQLFNLQVLSGKYRKLAMDNAVYPKRIYPNRGIIYDRKGKAILNNTIMYDLTVTPTQVKNIDTLEFCNLIGIDTAEFRKRILDARFKNGPVRPSVFEDLLPADIQAKLEENIYKFPGFTLVERPVRVYPFNAAAHIMGYVGEVDSAILKRSNFFYQLGDYVGRSGLENYYEKILMGRRGMQFLIKDNKNRIQGPYENGMYDTAAIAGRNMRTYIDIEVQQLAEKLMANKVGAVVAIEPRTGGIIAMVSGPNFNPNDLTGPFKQKNYGKMQLDVSGPLLNRAINGRYPPGSTFKPLGALVALDEGIINPSFGYPCGGAYYGCSRPVKCTHAGGGHARNLRLSIANSCNSYYSHIYRLTVENSEFGGVKNGYHKWKEYMNAFGLGQRLGVDLPSENGGNIPDTSVYNKVYRNSWNSCTNQTLGIGQDMMLATPLQLANTMCIIANKGYFYTPHFAEKFDGSSEEDTILNKFKVRHEVLTKIPDTAYNAVIRGMQDVVEIGTARVAQLPGIEVCAKTGTAENYRIIDGRRVQLEDNSVFVCFAPRVNPKIAIAVVVENAGFGSTWAGPIAALMMEKYLNDTLRTERLKEVERISAANLMPSYLVREQFKADSTRAYFWFKLRKDSSLIKKYIRKQSPQPATPKIPRDGRTPVIKNEAIIETRTTYKVKQSTATT